MNLTPLSGDELANARDKWDWVWTFEPSNSLQAKRLRLVSDALNGHATEAVPAIRSGWTPYLLHADRHFALTPLIAAEIEHWRVSGNLETQRRLVLIENWHETKFTPNGADRGVIQRYRKYGFASVCSDIRDRQWPADIALPKYAYRRPQKKWGMVVHCERGGHAKRIAKLATETIDEFLTRVAKTIDSL